MPEDKRATNTSLGVAAKQTKIVAANAYKWGVHLSSKVDEIPRVQVGPGPTAHLMCNVSNSAAFCVLQRHIYARKFPGIQMWRYSLSLLRSDSAK